MPAYNAAAYIQEALASVLAQQDYPLEIIVVNDGSTDETSARVREFGHNVTLCEMPRQGIFPTMNQGIHRAQGEWLAFADADDLWVPDRLAILFSAFDADPALSCVYGHVQNFYSPDTDADYRARVVCPPTPLPGLAHTTLLIRRADFLRVGLFPTEWRLGGFMFWFNRANAMGLKHSVLSDVVLRRRLHPGNTGIRERTSQRDYALVLKAVLEQKRAARTSGT